MTTDEPWFCGPCEHSTPGHDQEVCLIIDRPLGKSHHVACDCPCGTDDDPNIWKFS